jgi:hypothetical protein
MPWRSDGDGENFEQIIGAPLDEQIAYYAQHPPRILKAFDATPIAQPVGHQFDGHGGEIDQCFGLRCKCGGDSFSVIGYYLENEYGGETITVFVGPISIECNQCHARELLIDTRVHGHDGEQDISVTMYGEGEPQLCLCETCGGHKHKLIVRFEFATDVIDRFEDGKAIRDFGEQAAEDMFTWFTLLGACEKTSWLRRRQSTLVDFECA